MSKKELLAFLTLFLVIGGLIVGYQRLQWIDVEVDRGYSDEARANPYLAAEQFLKLNDVDVAIHEGLGKLDQLPPVDTVLILSSNHGSLSQRRINDLLQWVHEGGRLVTTVTDHYNDVVGTSGDRLLDPVYIYLAPNEEQPAPDSDHEEAFDSEFDSAFESAAEEQNNSSGAPNDDVSLDYNYLDDNASDDSSSEDSDLDDSDLDDSSVAETSLETAAQCSVRATAILFGDDEYETWVDVRGVYDIQYLGVDENIVGSVYGDAGYRFLQVAHGEGIITVFPSIDFWLNSRIDQHDHAHLLYQLTGSKVWMLYDRSAPSIVALIWKVAPYLVGVFFILLGLLSWRHSSRFGGVMNHTEQTRRQLLEHIGASAQLIWKKGNAESLLKPLQSEIADLLRANATNSKSDALSEGAIKYLAQQTQLSEEQIESALNFSKLRTEFELVDNIQMLQKIRNAL